MSWYGVDIGGANLKLADAAGLARTEYFPLWQRPGELAEALAHLWQEAPPSAGLAIAMTGELADCFATKAEGVMAILAAVAQASQDRPVRVYAVGGQWLSVDDAVAAPLRVAAANWHALAKFAGQFAPSGDALLVDIGSTTTDIIPLDAGAPCAIGATDPERLASGELVYTGVERSPVCAIVRTLQWRGCECPVAQELFATAWDAYLILGDLPESPTATHTADGRPATRACAHERLARVLCADRTLFDARDAHRAAIAIAAAQFEQIAQRGRLVIERFSEPPTTIIVSGQGEFLACRLAARLAPAARVVSLTDRLGPQSSRGATAYALAWLAQRELPT